MIRNPKDLARYDALERANHWLVGISFILLALSGLAFFHPAFYPLVQLFGGELIEALCAGGENRRGNGRDDVRRFAARLDRDDGGLGRCAHGSVSVTYPTRGYRLRLRRRHKKPRAGARGFVLAAKSRFRTCR